MHAHTGPLLATAALFTSSYPCHRITTKMGNCVNSKRGCFQTNMTHCGVVLHACFQNNSLELANTDTIFTVQTPETN